MKSLLQTILDYLFPVSEPKRIITIPHLTYSGCWKPRTISYADDITSYMSVIKRLSELGEIKTQSDILHDARVRREREERLDKLLRLIGLRLRTKEIPLPTPAPPLPLSSLPSPLVPPPVLDNLSRPAVDSGC